MTKSILPLVLLLMMAGCRDHSGETFSYQGENIRYSRTFNDMNERHLEAGREFGIQEPPETREDFNTAGLKEISSCKYYAVEPLTYSVPYLTPAAKDELEAIGRAFQDKLKAAGLPLYRPIVTSVLRTKEDVDKLRKVNINSSGNSSHCYGTTFDLACIRFDKLRKKDGEVPPADLKTALAEVLKAEKENGNVYVKYEVKQNCFHITCRK